MPEQGDRLIARLRSIASTLDGVGLAAGLPGRGEAAGEESGSELVEIGRRHEYGIGVPERPFMRTSAARYAGQWLDGARDAARRAIRGDARGTAQVLRVLGTVMVADVQQTIESGPWAPNSPVTIARKGSSRPLIDTSQMIQSIRAVLYDAEGGEELVG